MVLGSSKPAIIAYWIQALHAGYPLTFCHVVLFVAGLEYDFPVIELSMDFPSSRAVYSQSASTSYPTYLETRSCLKAISRRSQGVNGSAYEAPLLVPVSAHSD